MINGRIAETAPSPAGTQVRVRVEYFDDNDPANTGAGHLPPQVTIAKETLLYAPAPAAEIQASAKIAIKAKIAALEADRAAATAVAAMIDDARAFLPVGALIIAGS